MRRPRHRAAVALAALALGGAAPAPAQESQGVARGRRVYEEQCAVCHDPGAGHPGTELLMLKRGPAFAVIRGRRDLPPVYIEAVVRNGLIEMPPFRPTDVSDADLAALVQFLRSADPSAPSQ
ncbi:MAG: cytochrome c [Candidatus Binatia bacterium]